MSPTLDNLINGATLAVIGFSINLMLVRAAHQKVYLPLSVCLLAIGILVVQPVLAEAPLSLRMLLLVLTLPALYVIPPCFWLYVEGITSDRPWRWAPHHYKHLALSGVAFFIVIATMLLPIDIRHALLVEGNDEVLATVPVWLRYWVYSLLIMTFAMVLGWVLQAGYYIVRVLGRLKSYRQSLRQVFASTEHQEARWINALLIAIIGLWLFTATGLLYDNLIGPLPAYGPLGQIVILITIWSLALWGLRQKPGFSQLYQSDTKTQEEVAEVIDGKYQRSALHREMAEGICAKLTQAMEKDELYLDASLSLPKLARHISTPAHYVSQTLNETMNTTFFDYVNGHRVNAAKTQLEDTNHSILDVAMAVGFNAKSSFYSAFKKHAQTTPSNYRKQHQ